MPPYSHYVDQTAAQRRDLINEMRLIIDKAGLERRDLTATENGRFEAMEDQVDTLDARSAKLQKMSSAEVRTAEVSRSLGAAVGYAGDAQMRSDDPIRQMLEGGETRHDFRWPTQPEARYMFGDAGLDAETRALANFSDGSALRSTDFSSVVALYARTYSPWLKLATVINADNGRNLTLPQSTVDPTTFKPGEGTAITESTPTLGTVTLIPLAYKALSYISAEAMEDEEVNLTLLVGQQQGRSIGLAFGSDATTAILAGINNGGTATALGGYGTAVGNFIGFEDVLSLEFSRQAPYREAGVYVASNSALLRAKRWKDGMGQYIWPADAAVAGQAQTLNGHPVYEDPYLPVVAASSKSLVFGQASTLIIKASPLRVDLSRDFRFQTDEVAVKSVWRIGLAIPEPTGMAFLVSAAT